MEDLIKFAEESGAYTEGTVGLTIKFKFKDLELFFKRTQKAVLQDAANNVTIWLPEMDADERYHVREHLKRLSDRI